jgi:hypothetical protein
VPTGDEVAVDTGDEVACGDEVGEPTGDEVAGDTNVGPPPELVPAPQPAKIVAAAKTAPGNNKTRFTLGKHLSRRRPDNRQMQQGKDLLNPAFIW